MLHMGDLEFWYLKNGSRRYQIELSHDGLRKHRVIKGDDPGIVSRKADLQAAEWEEKWNAAKAKAREAKRRERNQSSAEQQSREAEHAVRVVENLLAHTLTLDDKIDWESLKNKEAFATPKPPAPDLPKPPSRPLPSDRKYMPEIQFLDRIIGSRRERKVKAAEQRFQEDMKSWEKTVAQTDAEAARLREQHAEEVARWKAAKAKYEADRKAANSAIDGQKQAWLTGDPRAVREYCETVLSRSEYPESFPQEFDLQFNPETKVLIVDYLLPALEDMPTLKDVTYVKSRDELKERHLSERQLNQLYDAALYQITLRTIHELFEADSINALDTIGFNGFVKTIDRATGKPIQPCVLTVRTRRDEFSAVDLRHVEPKKCFKALKGIGSPKLHSVTPVAPLMTMDREDSRFVESYGVAGELDQATNLAAIDWEDFEHLIREVFEMEFAQGGGEVKVTQASRDRGVDAIAFDPDPIRGGKIVIQAKRYTNTVGVSAVRDLYGTVLNEGATKGILVTTSDYGPDAHEFANGKPLTLLNGGHLLHLLERHGHAAKIDIPEARRLAAER